MIDPIYEQVVARMYTTIYFEIEVNTCTPNKSWIKGLLSKTFKSLLPVGKLK
jgi:hypothetical protein